MQHTTGKSMFDLITAKKKRSDFYYTILHVFSSDVFF